MNLKQNLYKIVFLLISFFIFVFSLYEIYYRTEKILLYEVIETAVPTLITLIILLVTILSEKKFPKATAITASVLCTLIVLIQFAWSFFVVEFAGIAQITDVNKYEKALSLTYYSDYIKHFPKHIPSHARNVQLYKSADNIFGSESIYLKFNTDRNFIETELSKYNYQREFFPKDTLIWDDPLFSYTDCHDCKYHIIYQISGKNNVYGIAEKENTIVYFYINP